MIDEQVLSAEQINAWKAEFGRVFKTDIGEDSVIWRKIRRREYGEVMDDNFGGEGITDYTRVLLRQEAIVAKCALWPENIVEVIENNAGLATSVADEIVIHSGFESPETKEL